MGKQSDAKANILKTTFETTTLTTNLDKMAQGQTGLPRENYIKHYALPPHEVLD